MIDYIYGLILINLNRISYQSKTDKFDCRHWSTELMNKYFLGQYNIGTNGSTKMDGQREKGRGRLRTVVSSTMVRRISPPVGVSSSSPSTSKKLAISATGSRTLINQMNCSLARLITILTSVFLVHFKVQLNSYIYIYIYINYFSEDVCVLCVCASCERACVGDVLYIINNNIVTYDSILPVDILAR